MKKLSLLLMLILFSCVTPALAEELDRAAQQNLYELQPIYTLNARNAQRITFSLQYDNFTNVKLEEADSFDGYTAKAELVVPFGENKGWEIRFEYPFRTDGDARFIETGESMDIEGDAGVFDFASIVLQKELSSADKCPVNTSIYGGFGARSAYLETSIDDKYNHAGQVFILGFNIDNARADRDLRFQGNIDARFYRDTDDLNPSSEDVEFNIVDLNGAVVYNTKSFIKPAFEVVYSTDFEDRQIIQAVPEFIIPLWDRAEIKGAYAFGHSNGEGSTETATLRGSFMF